MDDLLWRRLIPLLALHPGTFDEDVVRWAADALEAGLDTPSLRILAGLDTADGWTVDAYLQRALAELGAEVPTREGAVELHARNIAEDIVAGRVRPLDGCDALYALYRNGADWLVAWTGLDDEVSLARQGTYGTIEFAEREIRAEAQRMIGAGGGSDD